MDDELLTKLVLAEHDALRDVTGQANGQVPSYRPIAFTSSGRVD